MSFIQQTIKCKCGYEMNISTGTFGTGIPEECPSCRSKAQDYKIISQGWTAIESTTKTSDEVY
jgi:hypothetical protein